jgi:C4-dicarboxylate-specific signal transduction histidine kinase
MLVFSRKTEQEKVPLQLPGIVKEAMKLPWVSIPSTVRIRANIDSKSGLIIADPTQMQKVLINLCNNAAHAMREKASTIDESLIPTLSGSTHRVLRVFFSHPQRVLSVDM